MSGYAGADGGNIVVTRECDGNVPRVLSFVETAEVAAASRAKLKRRCPHSVVGTSSRQIKGQGYDEVGMHATRKWRMGYAHSAVGVTGTGCSGKFASIWAKPKLLVRLK